MHRTCPKHFVSVFHTFFIFCIGLCLADPALADVKLHKLFSDHVVLQRDRPIPVYGTARPGENVAVHFAGQTVSTQADAEGNWVVELMPLPASREPRELNVEGSNRITVKNVVVGDVWVCSGQSNMEWSLNNSMEPDREKKEADFPMIRHIKVPRVPHSTPQAELKATWTVCSPDTAGGYTAVGYFFARELHRKLGVPIGILNSSWGGTRVEPWTNVQGFESQKNEDFARPILKRIREADPASKEGRKRYSESIDKVRDWIQQAEKDLAAGKYLSPLPKVHGLGSSHQDPTRLYRGMIVPLLRSPIRGVTWYQGESNGGDGEGYRPKLHALVNGWRAAWGQGDFPFIWVQLANYNPDANKPEGGDGYARIREGMRKALEIPNSGMAVITDVGEARDIHPRNKQDVGYRLAQWALHYEYKKADVVPSGPLFRSSQVEGNSIRIQFDHVGGGLIIGKKDKLNPVKEIQNGKLKRFAVAGEDKKWVWAEARIDGDSVVVSSPEVPRPVAVRYAYSANPEGANLYNKAGLPASAFRTDDW